jgi:hypothetical protein
MQEQQHVEVPDIVTNLYIPTLESLEKGEKGEKIQNQIQNQKSSLPIDINSFNSINYITLETMSNNDSYNKYLKRNKMDHDSVLKKEKKFYRKRIIALTKDILFNNVNNVNNINNINNINNVTNQSLSNELTTTSSSTSLPHVDTPKIDDVIISAFNTYARLCISHFKFKDTMDTIQGEYKDMNIESFTENKNNIGGDDNGKQEDKDISNNLNEVNKLCMKQTDKKVLTLDNYVIKTSAPKKEMILPKTKNVNLKDPKFKKKDIKVSMTTSIIPETITSVIKTTTINTTTTTTAPSTIN